MLSKIRRQAIKNSNDVVFLTRHHYKTANDVNNERVEQRKWRVHLRVFGHKICRGKKPRDVIRYSACDIFRMPTLTFAFFVTKEFIDSTDYLKYTPKNIPKYLTNNTFHFGKNSTPCVLYYIYYIVINFFIYICQS